MKLLDAKINWNEKFANDPELYILVDKIPNFREIPHEVKSGLYFAEQEGYVSFIYEDLNDKRGFGGASNTFLMKDGSTKTVVGGWSSRCGVANKLGFTPSREVVIFTDKASFDRGYTGLAGAITEELYINTLSKFFPKVSWNYRNNDGEITIRIIKRWLNESSR